ncbi:TPA: hypothetical protein ACPFNP_002898, partial [Staphylococcus aureus]
FKSVSSFLDSALALLSVSAPTNNKFANASVATFFSELDFVFSPSLSLLLYSLQQNRCKID